MKAVSILALALAAAVATPAAAVKKAVTYRGTVYSASDTGGVLVVRDPADYTYYNVSISGMPYVARFVYETTLGHRSTIAGASDRIDGGESGPNPVLSATLTIGGVTLGFVGPGSVTRLYVEGRDELYYYSEQQVRYPNYYN